MTLQETAGAGQQRRASGSNNACPMDLINPQVHGIHMVVIRECQAEEGAGTGNAPQPSLEAAKAPRVRKPHRDHVYLDERYGCWIAEYRDACGRRCRRRAARTREAAIQVRRKWLDEVDLQKAGKGLLVADRSFSQLLGEYWKAVHPNKSPTTQRREEEIKQKLEAHFGKKLLVKIHPQDVRMYQTSRRGEVAAATVNREMVLLRHLFTMAVEWHYLLGSPAKGIKQLREENRLFRYLTFEEAPRMIESCNGYLRSMVLVDLHSGLRKGELLRLKWSEIDFDRGVLTVVNAKSGRSRHIPMNRVLTETLSSIERIAGSPYVFCKRDGKPFGSVNMGFRAARERVGLKDVRFHDLRHTFASWLVIRGVSLAVVRELLGHSSYEMTLRYAHLAPGQGAEAVHRLEARPNASGEDRQVEDGTPVARDRKSV